MPALQQENDFPCFLGVPLLRNRPRGRLTRSSQSPRRTRSRLLPHLSAHTGPQHPLFTSQSYRDSFLRTTWGKKPFLFRNLFPNYTPPLTPDELAGLSCSPGTHARLITGRYPGQFELRLGPFEESVFSTLPDTDWTLLLSDANYHVPALASLLSYFSFIPNWRVDDLMVSYAAPGGSVGPHVDNYDVFLVQAAGRRRWLTSYTPISATDELLAEGDVRVLRDGFETQEEWVLEPGDALYIPPRFPHHGVSLDDQCMTFSVGFRAPTIADLAHGWVEEVVERERLGEEFFADSYEDLVTNAGDPARVSEKAVDRAFEAVTGKLAQSESMREAFGKWFVQEVSMPKRFRTGGEGGDSLSVVEAGALVGDVLDVDDEQGSFVVRQQEGSVFLYSEDMEGVAMYIDGERWDVANVEIAKAICGQREIEAGHLARLGKNNPSVRGLLQRLFHSGFLYVCEEDFEQEADIGEGEAAFLSDSEEEESLLVKE